jgi:serine/threonine protein kinase
MDWMLRDPYGNCNLVHDYKKVNRIGEGTYGFVYRAFHKETNRVVALKRIILHHEEQEGFPLTSIREIKMLRRLHHPNIVSLVDVVVGSKRDSVFLLFEYCEHDLSYLLKRMKTPFKESELKSLFQQLLSAVEYIHKNWILHRDIKLSNLLYNNHGQLKLADFGLARTISYPNTQENNLLTPLVVTLWYRPPEILLGGTDYSFPIDIWSIGCVFAELILQTPLFCGMSELEQIMAIFKILGKLPLANVVPLALFMF